MIRINYWGTSNGGAFALGNPVPGCEVLAFPAAAYCRQSLSLARHVLGDALPGRRSTQRPWGLEFEGEGEITEAQADGLRRVFALANRIYDATGGDTAAAWRAVAEATGRDP